MSKGGIVKFYKDNSTVEDILHQIRFWQRSIKQMDENVNHPKHYNSHPSGIECIRITEHMGFNLGNAVKYIWRADLKGQQIEDLKKAAWYINREIEKRGSK